MASPSIIPADRLDRDIYIVLEDFGARAGCAWRETDESDPDLETVLQGLLSGQYAYPVRIVCFNAGEGWGRDATSDVADALAQRAADRDDEIPGSPAGLYRRQRHAALRRPARAAAAGRRVMFKEGKPGGAGPPPQSESDHFIRCTICGKMLDMRDLGQVLDHLHGQEIEEEPATH